MKQTYGVKAIITNLVNGSKRYYEEIIITVKAESFDEAYEKARIYIDKACFDYINPNGEKVEALGFELLDCFLAFEEEDGVCEVYSAFITNKTNLNEDEYYTAITDMCDAEETYVLRNAEFN